MPQTPNHEYNVPNEGAQDWHVPLNENFEQFDTDVEIRDADANKGNYTPKAGAKFLATDNGKVYVGDGSSWQHLPTTGPTPTFDGFTIDGALVAVGDSSPSRITTAELFGIRSDMSGYGGMYVDSTDSSGGRPFYGYSVDGDPEAWHYFDAGDESWYLDMPGGEMWVTTDGTVKSTASKDFVQGVDTDDGEKEVHYTATEAGTPRTEASGVVELEDGRAEVDLPDHFGWVTSDEEPLVVQVTPHASQPVRPQVTERSTDRIVVEDFERDADDYEVSYTVRGTRAGYEDKQVVREPSETPGRAADQPPSAGERQAGAD